MSCPSCRADQGHAQTCRLMAELHRDAAGKARRTLHRKEKEQRRDARRGDEGRGLMEETQTRMNRLHHAGVLWLDDLRVLPKMTVAWASKREVGEASGMVESRASKSLWRLRSLRLVEDEGGVRWRGLGDERTAQRVLELANERCAEAKA